MEWNRMKWNGKNGMVVSERGKLRDGDDGLDMSL